MGDERPPPPITLTDPLHPGPLHDVVTSDPPPWHPSRRQVAIVLAVVLVVAAAVTPYLVIRERDLREQRLLAAATVTLLDASDGDLGRTTTPKDFTLANPGTVALRLLTATLDEYPPVRLDTTLAGGDTTAVTVPLPPRCPGVVPVDRPGVMAVTYEVAGHERSQLLDVHGTTAAYAFRAALQARCLLYAVDEAVTGQVVETTAAGTVLRLRVELTDVGPQSPVLRGFRLVDGLRVDRVRPALPVRIPAATSFTDVGRVAADLDVVVSDCDAARRVVQTYTTGYLPPLQAIVMDGDEELLIEVEFSGPPMTSEVGAVVEAAC